MQIGLAIATLTFGFVVPVFAQTVTGAGSSAAAPLYKAWAKAYGNIKNFQLDYDAAGSTVGLRKIKANAVSFGASDVPPSEAALEKDRLVLVPTFISGAVPVINLPKIAAGKLRLSGEVLAAIFMGKITRWNASEIQSLNVETALPDLEIKPIVRSDGSGTTYYFTDYLSKVSPEFLGKFGVKTLISWPANFIGAAGAAGVSKTIKETAGAIGYIDFDYVTENNLNPVKLRNVAGEFVVPSALSFRAALRESEWNSKGNFSSPLTNLQGPNVWPITMGTFVLFPKVSQKSADTALALQFFVWALTKGDHITENMNVVRLPDKMQALAFKSISSVTDSQGKLLGIEAIAEQSKY